MLDKTYPPLNLKKDWKSKNREIKNQFWAKPCKKEKDIAKHPNERLPKTSPFPKIWQRPKNSPAAYKKKSQEHLTTSHQRRNTLCTAIKVPTAITLARLIPKMTIELWNNKQIERENSLYKLKQAIQKAKTKKKNIYPSTAVKKQFSPTSPKKK